MTTVMRMSLIIYPSYEPHLPIINVETNGPQVVSDLLSPSLCLYIRGFIAQVFQEINEYFSLYQRLFNRFISNYDVLFEGFEMPLSISEDYFFGRRNV